MKHVKIHISKGVVMAVLSDVFRIEGSVLIRSNFVKISLTLAMIKWICEITVRTSNRIESVEIQ